MALILARLGQVLFLRETVEPLRCWQGEAVLGVFKLAAVYGVVATIAVRIRLNPVRAECRENRFV